MSASEEAFLIDQRIQVMFSISRAQAARGHLLPQIRVRQPHKFLDLHSVI